MSDRLRPLVDRLGPRMSELLAVVPADRRPRAAHAHHVACLLAEDYRNNGKGYVDSTVAQLEARCAFVAVARILRALHEAGIWVRVDGHRGGAQTTGTRRVPGPVLIDLVTTDRPQVDRHDLDDLVTTDRPQVADGDERPQDDEHPTSGRFGADLMTTDRPTPHSVSPLRLPASLTAEHDTNGDEPTKARKATIDDTIADLETRYVAHVGQFGAVRDRHALIANKRAEIDALRPVIGSWLQRGARPYDCATSALARLVGDDPHAEPPIPQSEPTCRDCGGPDMGGNCPSCTAVSIPPDVRRLLHHPQEAT